MDLFFVGLLVGIAIALIIIALLFNHWRMKQRFKMTDPKHDHVYRTKNVEAIISASKKRSSHRTHKVE